VTEADRSALVALCLEWGRYLEATIRSGGLVVTTRKGQPMISPWYRVATRALAACLKLWPELGLTPSSRSRVTAAPAPGADPFAEFDVIEKPVTH
jgi:P27 family predicted phage terminase small subunit